MKHEPLLLAFDTSTAIGSVGLGRGVRVLASDRISEERAQASSLIPTVGAVLKAAGLKRGDLLGIVVGRGPGSFTGVRVAAATAQGLAHGLGIPVWAVSSLAAAALSAGDGTPGPVGTGSDLERITSDDARPRYVLFDARSDRVYAGCYRLRRTAGGPDGVEVVVPPTATVIDSVVEGAPEGSVFCGDAALRHVDHIRAAGFPVAAFPLGRPTAAGLFRAHAALGGDPLPRGWEPEYLRESSARPPAHAGGPK